MRRIIECGLLALMLCGRAAIAAEGEDVRKLAPFDRIEISKGVAAKLTCGEDYKATVTGTADDRADTRVAVEGHTLVVTRNANFQNSHSTVQVQLATGKPIEKISVSTGVTLQAESCALSSDKLEIDASTGATVKMAAAVNHLTVDAGLGAEIKPISGQRIDAKLASIHATTGVDIRLCSIEVLEGNASLGADISAESIRTNSVHTGLGADVSTRSCH